MRKYVRLVLVIVLVSSTVALFHINACSGTSKSTSVTELWRFPTYGSVYSAPIVFGGYLYANSYFDQAALGGVYCLNYSTGKQAWNYTTDPTSEGRPFSPVVADGRVYFNVQSGNLYCLNAHTGARFWNFSNAGYDHAPALSNGRVYLTSTDGNVYALDASTGTKFWNRSLGSVYGKPIVAEGSVFVTGSFSEGPSSQGRVYCLDASTGNETWEATIPDQAGFLAVSGGYAYLSSYSARNLGTEIYYVGGLHAFDARTGTEEWNYTTANYFAQDSPTAVPIVADQLLHINLGNITHALDALKGNEKWSFACEKPIDTLLVSSQNLYLTSGATIYCLDAFTGAEKWAYVSEGERVSAPVVVEDRVYVGSAGSWSWAQTIYHHVYAVDASSGKKVWNYMIEGNAGSLAVADGVVYVGAGFVTRGSPTFEGNGAVYALKPAEASLPSLPFFSELHIAFLAIATAFVLVAVGLLLYFRKRRREEAST